VTCPTPEALSRAFSEGADLSAHLAGCDACRAAWSDYTRLRDAARQLPWSAGDAVTGEARLIEAALVERKAGRRARTLQTRAAIGLAIAASVAAFFLTSRSEPATSATERAPVATAATKRATVRDAQAARFAHVTRTAPGVAHDEVITLDEGTIALDVAKLEVGERFRVVTADAEVEVRGTSFEVVVDHDHLARVAVISGRVVVRPRGADEVVLGPGESWTPPVRPTGLASSERLFQQGWDALRAGDLATGETHLAALVAQDPHDALAEDARYWRAVIAQRAHRTDDARTLWRALLATHPGSARAPEASVMLGWLELERGDKETAARLFAKGATSPDAEIAASAKTGLERTSAKN